MPLGVNYRGTTLARGCTTTATESAGRRGLRRPAPSGWFDLQAVNANLTHKSELLDQLKQALQEVLQ